MALLHKHPNLQGCPLYWAPSLQPAAHDLCKNFMSPVVAQNRLDLERDGCKHLRLRCAGALHLQWNLHANPKATKEDIRIMPALVKNTKETNGKSTFPAELMKRLCATTCARLPPARKVENRCDRHVRSACEASRTSQRHVKKPLRGT